MVWGDVVVTSHFEGRSTCVSHGMTDQSESDGYSFKYTMRTYTVLIVVYHTTPRTRRFEFFLEGSKAHRERKTPPYIYIYWIYTCSTTNTRYVLKMYVNRYLGFRDPAHVQPRDGIP